MHIGLIRGPYFSEFESQTYEPLVKHYDITLYCTESIFYGIRDTNLRIKKLKPLENMLSYQAEAFVRPALHLFGFYYYMLDLEEELRSVDIAHTLETFNAFSYQAVKAKKKYGTRVVVTQWETYAHNHENLILSRYIKGLVLKNADLFIVASKRAKSALMHEGVPEEKISVIPNGVNLEKFKPKEKDEQCLKVFNLRSDDFVILFVGRLVREKGVYDLIYATNLLVQDNELNKSIKSVKLLIRGEGREKENIRRLIDKLGIAQNVVFVGRLPYDEMPKLYNLADVYVQPSIPAKTWEEQWGYITIEAMACGKPVIGTLSGTIPKQVGNAGLLVPPSNPLSLFKKIKDLMLDNSKRIKLGKLARKRVEEKYDNKRLAIKLKNAYESLKVS